MLASKDEKMKRNKKLQKDHVVIDESWFGLSEFDDIEGFYQKQVNKAETRSMSSFKQSLKVQRQESENLKLLQNKGGQSMVKQDTTDFQDTINNNKSGQEAMFNAYLSEEFILHIIKDEKWYKTMKAKNSDKNVRQHKIIDKIFKILKHDRNEWFDLLEKNEDNREEDDLENKQEKAKWKVSKIDQFEWLHVPSKFNLLKKMVREKLVEIIGEADQVAKIEKAMDMYLKEKMKNPDHKLFNSKINQDELKKQKDMEALHATGDFKPHAPNKRNLSQKCFMAHFDDNEPREFQGAMAIGKVSAFPPDFKWDHQKEEKFKKAIDNASSQLYPMVKSSSFRENGFSDFVQKVSRQAQNFNDNEDRPCFNVYNEGDGSDYEDEQDTQKKTTNLRDELLNRYMSGEWMTVQEIKYICMSSLTLNKFLDRKFHQGATNILDPEFIEGIEMDIAEQIIYSYYEIRNKIKDHRDSYLKRQNDHLHKKIYHQVPNQKKDFPEPFSYKLGQKAMSELTIHRKFLNLQNEIVRDVQLKNQKKKEEDKLQKDNNDSKISVDIDVPSEYHEGKWLKKVQSKNYNNNPKVLENVKAKNMTDLKDMKFSVSYGKTTEKTLLHKQHPPSKIFNMNVAFNKKEKEEKSEMEKYKLNRIYDDKFVQKKDFFKVYSAGPLIRDYKLKRPKELIHRAVVYIQKIARGYIQRNLFKKYKKEKSIQAEFKGTFIPPPSATHLYRPKYKKNFLTENRNMTNVFAQNCKSLQNLKRLRKETNIYNEVLGYTDGKKVSRVGSFTRTFDSPQFKRFRDDSGNYVKANKKTSILKQRMGSGAEESRLSYNESQDLGKTKLDLTKSMNQMQILDTNLNTSNAVNFKDYNTNVSKSYNNVRKSTNYGDARLSLQKDIVDKKPQKMEYTNPYVFSAKYYAAQKRPVTCFDSRNRKELRRKIVDFNNKYNLKQKQIQDCLRDRDFKRLANSNFVFIKLDVNIRDEFDIPVQNLACQMQETEFVKFLIKKGGNVNSRDKWGNTPLMDAFANGNKKIIELLLHNHARLDLYNCEKASAFDKCNKILKEDTKWLQMIEEIYNFRTYHDIA